MLGVITATFGLLAGCGAPSDESASPSSLPFEEPTTTAAESPAPSSPSPSPDTADEAADAEPPLTAEMFEGMLETEAGRSLLIASIAGETGVDPEAAECLLDAIPPETLVEAAESFLGGETDAGFFSAEQAAEMAPLLDSCGIAVESLLP